MKRKKGPALLAACGLAVLLVLAGALLLRLRREEAHTASSFAMGAYVQQTLYGPGGEAAARQAGEAIARLENSISWRREGGSVWQLNKAAGSGPAGLDGEARQVLETALAVCKASGGAFDVTIAPVSRLWDFDNEPRLPGGDELRTALALVGWQGLSLTGDSAALARPGMGVDLGAAGKGAACDTAISCYRAAGIESAVVAVGGSVGLYGEKPGGGPWRVSVRDPDGQGALGVLEVGPGFVSTSGSYEKYFQQDGRTYHHLLDPRTGLPAESGLVSVTVVSGSGVLSDCLSTACFVLGYEGSQPLLEEFGAEALFVRGGREILLTPGLEGAFTPGTEGDNPN